MADSASALPMWTIYDHPTDYPYDFVARRWLAEAAGPRPTGEILVGPSLEGLRGALAHMGLVCMPRNHGDDPKIVEVWL